MRHLMQILCLAFALLIVPAVSQAEDVQNLAEYKPQQLGEVSMQSVGSDSMASLISMWTDKFKTFHPKLTVNVLSQGSAAAPAALVDGSADLGPMARPMKTDELAHFRRKYGFEPTRVRTAIAAAAIYVSDKNPISSISIEQLNTIFSKKTNAEMSQLTWSKLGVTGEMASKPVIAFGSKGNPYVASYFQQRVLLQDEFSERIQFTASNRALFEIIEKSPNAIAFGNLEAAPAGMKILPVIARGENKAIEPKREIIESGEYPLGRFLNIYVAMGPAETLEPATKEFLLFILSRDGQQMVEAEGLLSLSSAVTNAELAKLK